MASVLSSANTQKHTDAAPGAAPVPVLRDGARSTAGAETTAKPATVSQTPSSELGVPGSFPRDPRAALDRLSDQVESTGTETTDNGTILGAAREDIRHAVDAASKYLSDSVVGAFGSVFPVGAIDANAKADEQLDASREGQSSSKFTLNPKDVAVAGIASDYDPSSSESRGAAGDTSKSASADPLTSSKSVSAIGTTSESKPSASTMEPRQFTSPSVARALDSTASTKDDSDDVDTPAASPTPVPRGRSRGPAGLASIPASKEKRDNDVSGPGQTTENIMEGKKSDTDLRKKAIETAALGAGVGTLGGAAAYEHSRSGSDSEKLATTTTTSSYSAPQAQDPSTHTPAVSQAGGSKAAFSSSKPQDSSSQPMTSGAWLASGTAARDVPSDTDTGSKDQPAFATYAAAPVITETTTPPSEAGEKYVPSGAIMSTSESDSSNAIQNKDAQTSSDTSDTMPKSDSNKKKGIQAVALGAGIGTIGGATYEHSQSKESPESQSQSQSQSQSASASKSAQVPAAARDEGVPSTGTGTGQSPVSQTQNSSGATQTDLGSTTQRDDTSHSQADQAADTDAGSKSSKATQDAALGLGGGVLGGGAAYEAQRWSAQGPTSTTQGTFDTSSAKDATATKDRDAKPSAGYADAPGVSETQRPGVSGAAKDSKAKKGVGAAALGAGLGTAGGVAAYEHSRSSQDKVPGTAPSQPQSQVLDSTDKSAAGALSSDSKSSGRTGYAESAPTYTTGDAPRDISDTSGVTSQGNKEPVGVGAGAGAVGTVAYATANDKNAQKEQQKREKEVEKEAEKRKKEVEKREKDVEKREKEAKKHEKDAAAASEKRVRRVEKQLQKDDRRQEKEVQKAVEKGQAKREKEEKRQEKEMAAAAGVGAAGVGAGAGLASNKLTKGSDDSDISAKRAGTPTSQRSGTSAAEGTGPVHPSVKAASSAPPGRPGPTALGAAGAHGRATSGTDSDFPLPSESANASTGSVVKPVDISGSGNSKGAGTDVGAAAATSGTSAPRQGQTERAGQTETYRSGNHGPEGLQEKYEGGRLSSSTIERKQAEEEKKTNGSGSGHGEAKKEGFMRHIVEKVKDKLHHHEK